jgi:hypothetical protein
MKKLVITFVVSSLFILSGCDDKDARDYAQELVGVLKSYQGEVNKKIAAEQASYKDLAGTYAYARQVDVLTTLRTERLRRAESLPDVLMQGEKKITSAEIHALVADYAKSDFEATRQMLEQESDGQAEYLASLETLELQAQNITALTKALEELAKPKSDIKKLKELGAAAKEFKDKFDSLECEDMARQLACLKAKQSDIDKQANKDQAQKDKEKAKIQSEIERLLEQTGEHKCDSKKRDATTCPDKKGE